MLDVNEYGVPPPQSTLSWFLDALGPFYLVTLPLLGLLLLVGGLFVVFASRRPRVIASCLLFVPLPLLLGLQGMLQGMLRSFTNASAPETSQLIADVARSFSSAMVVPLVALLVTLPGYLVLATGLLARSLAVARSESPD